MTSMGAPRSGIRSRAAAMFPRSLRAGMTMEMDFGFSSRMTGRMTITDVRAKCLRSGMAGRTQLINAPRPNSFHGKYAVDRERTRSIPASLQMLSRSVQVMKVVGSAPDFKPKCSARV